MRWLGWIWVPVGLTMDRCLSLRASESPVRNPIYPKRQTNPAAEAKFTTRERVLYSPDARFPFVMMTYRLTGITLRWHVTDSLAPGGATARDVLRDLVELAKDLSVTQRMGDDRNARGAIEAHALVTPRIRLAHH